MVFPLSFSFSISFPKIRKSVFRISLYHFFIPILFFNFKLSSDSLSFKDSTSFLKIRKNAFLIFVLFSSSLNYHVFPYSFFHLFIIIHGLSLKDKAYGCFVLCKVVLGLRPVFFITFFLWNFHLASLSLSLVTILAAIKDWSSSVASVVRFFYFSLF